MVFHLPKEDEEIIRAHTPWIISPVDKHASAASEIIPSSSDEDKAEKSTGPSQRPSENGNVLVKSRSSDSWASRRKEHKPGAVVLKSHPKANAIELFYDLFFVANLTTFTQNHEISGAENLKSYLGFFTLMWFTWLQTTFFDVRFSFDSVFDRICKALSFGVMTGFAIVSSQFLTNRINDPDPALDTSSAFRAMALILMVSRLVFMAQYAVALWFTRSYPRSRMALVSNIAVEFISAMVFLGTYWAFPGDGSGTHTSGYAGWYTIVVVEALAMSSIATWWPELGFKRTNLIERVGLLSLIIMGEGVIGMTRSVGIILLNTRTVSGETMGTIVAAVLLIYFVWVLYFDQIDDHRFGVLRQPLWAILHFPLHISLLLTLEGSAQFIIWDQLVQKVKWLGSHIQMYPGEWPDAAAFVESARENLTMFNELFRENNVLSYYDYTVNLTRIATLDFKNATQLQQAVKVATIMDGGLIRFLLHNYNIPIPSSTGTSLEASQEAIRDVDQTFVTVWMYYIISAGLFVVQLGIMYLIGTKHKSRSEYAAVALRVLAGSGLTLLAISTVTGVFVNLILSPWVIPLSVIVYFIVIAIDNFLMWAWARHKFTQREMDDVADS